MTDNSRSLEQPTPGGAGAEGDDLVTISRAAEILGLERGRVQGWVTRKRVTRYRSQLGKYTLVSLAELRRKLEIRPVTD